MISAMDRYKKKLARRLPCCKDTKKRLLGSMEPTLEAYLQDAPNADYAAICAAFGPPEEMAKQLMQEVTPQERKKFKVRRIVALSVLGVLFALFVGFTIHVYFDKEIPTYVEYDTVIIVEESENTTAETTEETTEGNADIPEE